MVRPIVDSRGNVISGEQVAERTNIIGARNFRGGLPDADANLSFVPMDRRGVAGLQGMAQAGVNWYISRQSLKVTGRVVVPVFGNPQGLTAEVLPPQGLAGGPAPNNNVSVVLQLQAEF